MRQNPHVRICGGPGSATTLVYPTGVHPDGLELRVEADTAIAPALGDRERGVPARVTRRDVAGTTRHAPPDAENPQRGFRCSCAWALAVRGESPASHRDR